MGHPLLDEDPALTLDSRVSSTEPKTTQENSSDGKGDENKISDPSLDE